MVVSERPSYVRPKASVGRTLSNDIVSKTRDLLNKYEEIPLNIFGILFSANYGEVFDATDLGFDNGIIGFFEQLSGMIKLSQSGKKIVCSLHEHAKVARKQKLYSEKGLEEFIFLIQDIHSKRRAQDLFNEEHTLLWTMRYRKYLEYDCLKSIKIPMSPMELALEKNPQGFAEQVCKIREVFRHFPNGIQQNQIISYVSIDKRLFNCYSMNQLVDLYPEIFFRLDSKKDEDELVFDGFERTYFDFSIDLETSKFTPFIIVFRCITSGLYQKTLIMIRVAGCDGLKLVVWKQSMLDNFKKEKKRPYEEELMELKPTVIFQALQSYGLVSLKSNPSCKNDIRIHFPDKRLNFNQFFEEEIVTPIKSKTSSAENSTTTTSSGGVENDSGSSSSRC